jgi:hypothetical protein
VRHFPEVASLVGSQHSFIDVHGYALAAQLGLDGEPCVLGGLSADSLLKLTYWVRPDAAYRSARLPGLREDLLREADARRNGFLGELRALRPASAGEWLSLWPFAMRKHGGNVDGNRRLFRSFEAFHTNGVLDVAAAARPEWKRDRRLYRAAMRPLLARARHVPHTDYRFPYYGRLGNALLVPGLVLARALRGVLTRELRVRQRSWPKWYGVAQGVAEYERAVLEQSPVPGLIAEAGVGSLQLAQWPALRRLVFVQLGWLLAPALQTSSRNSPDATSRMATRPASMM